jgi:hypothetical protein
MTEKIKFIDFVKTLKDTYLRKAETEGYHNDDVTFDYVIDIYSENIQKELIENMCKIYDHFNEAFDNFLKVAKINKTNYDLNVVFNRQPENDEIARFVACIKNLEYDFNVIYKAVWLDKDDDGEKKFNMIEITVKEK